MCEDICQCIGHLYKKTCAPVGTLHSPRINMSYVYFLLSKYKGLKNRVWKSLERSERELGVQRVQERISVKSILETSSHFLFVFQTFIFN